jgi:hypothetical protein
MAHPYTKSVRSADMPRVLLKAVFRGSEAEGLSNVATNEDRLATVQGLGFIFLAFLLQLSGMIVDLFTFP